MSEKLSEREFHEKMSKNLFNKTWDLMEKKDRNPEEDLEMIHSAHASAHHWRHFGKPINFQRGEWQISRVYARLNLAESCLYHAEKCLALTKKHDIKDFDLAFAYEAMARAYAIAGNKEEKEKFLDCAKKAADAVKDEEDKKYTLSEIATIN